MARSLGNKRSLRLLTRSLDSPSLRRALLTSSPSSPPSLQTLAYEEVAPPSPDDNPVAPTAFVLHGLLGSGRNWRSFSRSLASTLSAASAEWRMVMVDLRNHGSSAQLGGFGPPHDMFNAAKDLADLVKSRGWAWPDAVVGHSMGGKVALQFAQSCARGDYGESAACPRLSSCGCWILSQEK